MSLSVHTIYRQIFKIWRRRRFQLFLDLMRPKLSDTLLDVGGYPGFWTSHPQPVKRIDSLNTHERPSAEQISAMVESTRLLRKSEMHELFPDCEIVTERMLWMIPKSYIAMRRTN